MLSWLFKKWLWGLVFAGLFGLYSTYQDWESSQNLDPAVIEISDYIDSSRANYILYGDSYDGGGHKYGVGKACKSEFPSDWGDTKILHEISLIAANDNLNWHKEGNGYRVVEHVSDGVRIRVIFNPARGSVVTAYPRNTPRNPCPAPANER